MVSDNPILQAQGITVRRGSASLLVDVDISLNSGAMTVILGPNGAGKTSLLRCIAAESKPSSGDIVFLGQALHEWRRRDLARHLAVLPQQSSLNFPFIVREVVLLGRMPHDSGLERDAVIVEELLTALDIVHLADRDYTSLSGGEKQRVQLARVLAQVWDVPEQALLVLDEPSNFLDLSHQSQIMRLLQSFTQRGAAVLTVLHDFNLAGRYADNVAVLEKGHLVASGKPRDVITAELMRDVFDVEACVSIAEGYDFPVVYAV
jgi:iron complex transport system ATP-binding protein